MATRAQLDALPKAHLHLHFTGSLSPAALAALAARAGVRLPAALSGAQAVRVSPDARGWFRFQRLYDAARAVVRGEEAMREVIRTAAALDRAEGSRWLELQLDPTSYAPFVGGITPALEIALDEARAVSDEGFGMALIVAASRTRHPLDARALARLAAQHAGSGAGQVVGFGLSNDERAGSTAAFGPAFAIARRAGLAALPHGGELLGPAHIREVVRELRPTRLGHGVRAAEDPALLAALVEAGIALEACPVSNERLGVYPAAGDVPLRALVDAGATVALGADDPLIFDARLTDQYAVAHAAGFDAHGLAQLARMSFSASLAPERIRAAALADIEAWEARTAG
ncbi:adenosine deaminase [Brevibacterium sp. 5221]|uniref:Adenosine deaminase n=1 Tax=Brevibacterium rongguiense TaxID=2695267 RepID=A0A6N9H404_9MICO|nr:MULTISPECIES: adenosine deaminase [Brevibacterium]MYM18486.1 adenosine deaminase [Brevibacterium rongguiense]WAL41537.1 adenosine deaminase [Brevibacterium sp. BRM-1]